MTSRENRLARMNNRRSARLSSTSAFATLGTPSYLGAFAAGALLPSVVPNPNTSDSVALVAGLAATMFGRIDLGFGLFAGLVTRRLLLPPRGVTITVTP